MVDETNMEDAPEATEPSAPKTRRRAARRPAGPPADAPTDSAADSPADSPADEAVEAKPKRRRATKKASAAEPEPQDDAVKAPPPAVPLFKAAEPVEVAPAGDDGETTTKRRRSTRSRRKKSDDAEVAVDETSTEADEPTESTAEDASGDGPVRKRRRRRRKGADADSEPNPDDPPNTVVKVREPRQREDVTGVRGSTRLEAKKQRRREGREAGRRRATILSEAEFLARREAVDRVMVVRQQGDRTQVAALEDGVLVEHYVHRGSSTSMVGNVYLGRVQNVLPSMEAAFVDIGRGRNAVLYAGEVNWDAAGLEGQPKRIEFALKSGDSVLVQVTKDPVGQKGARLTSQVSLPGRFLVYVPDGSMTGISRKLPDSERSRLRGILKRVMPEDAGVIIRTAAEGASEAALEHDISRLQAQWEDISTKAQTAQAPALLSAEPDLAIKVVRDIFNEDVSKMVISGEGAWSTIESYVSSVAPDLVDRLSRWVEPGDVFDHYRIDEQLLKALDRKVYLPSGGSLVIDRTEAMTVIDVNTGKFVGAGGNLEETVTKNNLEAAEEIVRQLRLRDVGGIIVVDFIDMVLESNRESVLRRLLECLGRDRTKHQVAEVTSLGLVQMTRKRIGQGLIEAFSTSCDECGGRGLKISLHDHHESAKRPKSGVDPADVAARSLVNEDGEESPELDIERDIETVVEEEPEESQAG